MVLQFAESDAVLHRGSPALGGSVNLLHQTLVFLLFCKTISLVFVMDPSRYESTCSHLLVIILKCPDDTCNSIAVQICLNPLPIPWLTTWSTTATLISSLILFLTPLSLSLPYSLLVIFPPPLLQHLVLIFSVVWTTTEANIIMFTFGL